MRMGRPKRLEKKRNPWLNFGSSFYLLFLLPLSLPYVNWASQEGCLLHLRFSLQSSDLPLFYFRGLFPSLSFSHRRSELLFPILTTWQLYLGVKLEVCGMVILHVYIFYIVLIHLCHKAHYDVCTLKS